MESDLLETLLYVITIGVIPYLAVEAYELVQRTIGKHRPLRRH